ncbi:hypothetical protein M422DRAFT_270782 [Sphaerobolus stellatus SS14]|uniref:Uncharacterized protein n=1 Tax=Sphaerobolus stellatus (strain SS14) TaxID=990650 RepID=A0A0C9TFB1_SPHS4|nr:hypothetical protein M422DRAFT_270782 [Sphaerobolus stellatus SS14]
MVFAFSHFIQQERVYVWKQAKTLLFYIFLVLRYFPPIVLIIAFDFQYVLLPDSQPVLPNNLGIRLLPLNCELSTIWIACAPVISGASGVKTSEDNIEGIYTVFPRIGDLIGNINVQLTSVITSVIVSHLFLDLREAAYRSHKSYNSPSAITATVGEWFNFNQSESGQSDPNIQPGCHTRENWFIGQRTLRDLMEYEDFAVDLQHFDDGDYNSMSEDQEPFLKENFEVGL